MYLAISTVLSSHLLNKHLPETTMKIVICVCFFALVALAYARPEDKYTEKYDNVNLDEIMGNDRLFESYFKCLLDEGPCTVEGKELKPKISDALETECSKCNEKQKEGVRKVFKHLINNKPEHWQKLCAKYDPDHKYAHKYENELKTIKA